MLSGNDGSLEMSGRGQGNELNKWEIGNLETGQLGNWEMGSGQMGDWKQ
jgi:hypothetical protein